MVQRQNRRRTDDHFREISAGAVAGTADVDAAVETGLADADRDLGGGWRGQQSAAAARVAAMSEAFGETFQ